MPGRSLALPTWATQPPATVGSSGRSTIRSFIPLGSVFSTTGTFWADNEPTSARPSVSPRRARGIATLGRGRVLEFSTALGQHQSGEASTERFGHSGSLSQGRFPDGQGSVESYNSVAG